MSVPSISKEVLALGNTTGIFDREKSDFHFLTAEARDDLGRGNRNTVELLIRLTDVNDNPPIFEQKEYVGFLKENNLSFEQTVFVSAHDADENGTENSVVIFLEITLLKIKKNKNLHNFSNCFRSDTELSRVILMAILQLIALQARSIKRGVWNRHHHLEPIE